MKPILRITIILLASMFFVSNIIAEEPPKEMSTTEKQLEDLFSGGLEENVPERSMIPIAKGVINHATKTIHLEFRRSVGDVVVTITNKQGVVAISTRASTEMQILLPLPATGEYEITIVGERYSGVSNFVID